MLGPTFRYQVYNGTGVTITMTVTEKRWKFGSDGSLTFSTEQTPISAVGVTTLAYSNSATIDNSTDKYVGAHLAVLFDVPSAATGSVLVYIQRSTDGGTDWPSNSFGEFLGGYYFNASSTDTTINVEA